MASILDIEGIGPIFAEKLAKAGIRTIEGLLLEGASASGRGKIADASGIDESKILRWVNMADLFRIKGVGEEYADLLEAAGVDTVKELATRRPDNLQEKMAEINESKKLVRQVPSLKSVTDWVAQAKELDPKVTH